MVDLSPNIQTITLKANDLNLLIKIQIVGSDFKT